MNLQLAGAAAAGVVAGAIAGYALHRPAVKIVEKVVEKEKRVEVKIAETATQAGPRIETRVVTRTITGPQGPERVVERIRVEQGPTTIIQRTQEAALATRELEHVVRVTPAPAPSWAVYGGLQLFPEKMPVLGVGRRLLGPIWIEAWARPRLELALPAAGVQLRVEF